MPASLFAPPSLAASDCDKRLRRRGPHSHLAVLRRSVVKCCRTLPGTSAGESGDSVPEPLVCNKLQRSSQFAFSKSTPVLDGHNSSLDGVHHHNVNIQCLSAHLAELILQLQLNRPHVVLIQDAWLNRSIEDVEVEGYIPVSTRDLHENDIRGDLITYQLDEFKWLYAYFEFNIR